MTDHLLERLEHQEGMLRRDPSRHHLHAADALRDARLETTRLRERERRLHEMARRAIGDHSPPDDCYATGPLTGDPFADLVQCPACVLLAALGDAAAPTPDMESE